MNFDLITFILGNMTGFTVAVLISRRKFSVLQNEARELLDRIRLLRNDLVVERSLNEGLTQELDTLTIKTSTRKR